MKARHNINSIELYYLKKELEQLKGRRIKKVYQLTDDVFSLTIWPEINGRRELIFATKSCVFLSKRSWPKPDVPSSLAMGLRKRLKNARIVEIQQPDMERSLIITYEGAYSGNLIVELFGRGNLILTNEKGEIVQLSRSVRVKDRILRRHEIYKPPPRILGVPSIIDLKEKDEISLLIREHEGLEVWRLLIGMGVGPPYLNEVLLKSEVSANERIGELGMEKISSLAEAIIWLAKRLKEEPKPIAYLHKGKMIDFSVFPLDSLSEYESRGFSSLIELLDEYFSPLVSDSLEGRTLLEIERKLRALETELHKQKALLRGYEDEMIELRRKGEILFSNLYEAQSLMEMAKRGIENERILKVDRSKDLAVIEVEKTPIEVDLSMSASENASNYYERAKKLALKVKRGKKALKELENRLSAMKSKYELMQVAKRAKIRKRRKWFEKFRWFFSTEGFLVLAGRDKQTNRELVRRYMEEEDLFFHVEGLEGAVVLVKVEGRPVGKDTIAQAADYAACFSKAWKEGLSYADVYYVLGKQVKSHAPPGMYIPKGSFYIEGKRNHVKGKLELVIGVLEVNGEFKLISCPTEASGRMKVLVKVVPGEEEKMAATKRIKEELERRLKKVTSMPLYLDLDEILKALPSGRFKVLRR